MSMFWLIAVVLLSLALGLPLLLLRRAERGSETAGAGERSALIAHCRDMLVALEHERSEGLIDEAAFETERARTARRLIAAEAAKNDDPVGACPAPIGWAALAMLVAGPLLVGVGVYLALGRPDLPAAPARVKETAREEGKDPASVQLPGLVEELARRLKTHPERVDGWRLLARTALDLGRTDLVLEATREGLKRAPDDRELLLERAEALIAKAGGRVTPAAILALEELARREPDHPAPRYYAGLKRLQEGDAETALKIWHELLSAAPEDAPWRDRIAREVERVETMQAMQEASPEARRSMIRAMVARLEERLARHPDDASGWQRLARSYLVLGETQKAVRALQRLRTLVPQAQRSAIDREIARIQQIDRPEKGRKKEDGQE
ncbi:MAG: c-type cytochrome biogenesis protein CcmI [Alphaproteobacteria bacterium]|nr:MAG: c-type cytochrome biogenesis protein CcmI [Alphaproteobacteria bacterium]